ncbi:MAG: hypothetical protein IPG58_19815 [Acidobacteria bacterium]|nr:hypothetical protein [Acidobacteriota bacterium]
MIASDAYNVSLPQRRAAEVKQWLVTKGGKNPNLLVTNVYGKNKTVAPKETRTAQTIQPDGRGIGVSRSAFPVHQSPDRSSGTFVMVFLVKSQVVISLKPCVYNLFLSDLP